MIHILREHDFWVGILSGGVFFILELVVIVWGIPALIDRHNEKRRLPARRIAAQRIAEEVGDLLTAHSSLNLGVAVANRIAVGEDFVTHVGGAFKYRNEELERMIARIDALAGKFPSAGPADAPPPSEAEKKQRAEKRLRLERLKELFIVRYVSGVVHAFEELERTIDTFIPILSVDMLGSIAKLYQYLARIKRPFAALEKLIQNPDDASLVFEPTLAAISAPDLIKLLKAVCHHVGFDISTMDSKWASYPKETDQLDKIDKFLDLHFEDSLRSLKRKLGLIPPLPSGLPAD